MASVRCVAARGGAGGALRNNRPGSSVSFETRGAARFARAGACEAAVRRCGCGRGLRRALGRREDSACTLGADAQIDRVDDWSYRYPLAESSRQDFVP